jgi:hypothetical protein
MMKQQSNRVKVTSMMDAFEKFCDKHLRAVPGWLAAEYLKMTPQGLYQASERGWIAYFQHGRNRIYSWKDIVSYRHQSRKFKDNTQGRPHRPGNARFDFEVVPSRPLTAGQLAVQEKAELKELHTQAVEATKGRAPWPFERRKL